MAIQNFGLLCFLGGALSCFFITSLLTILNLSILKCGLSILDSVSCLCSV